MAKAELRSAQESYDAQMLLADQALTGGRYAEAIAHAKAAWPLVDDMMKYERRWEGTEFKSVPCIDLVIRYAPLRLDSGSLDELEALLRTKKSIDRHASDDIAARLVDARELIHSAHRLWDYLETHPNVRQDRLDDELGGPQATWRWIAEQWEGMGLLARTKHAGSYLLRLVTDMNAQARGLCSSCSASAGGRRRKLLKPQECPRCGRTVSFVLVRGGLSLVEAQPC
jgi:hypothetical protein